MKHALRFAALAAVAAALLFLLARYGDLSWRAMVQAGARISLSTLLCLTALLGANLALCTAKWQLAMRALAPDHRSQPGFLDAMLATTLGALLGQVMPFQVGVGLARAAAGLSGIGSPGLNLGTTLYEQLFDLIVLAAAAAVGVVGLILHAGAEDWIVLALAGGGASVVAALRLAWLLEAAARVCRRALASERFRRLTAALVYAAERAAETPRPVLLRLIACSALRYATFVGWTVVLLGAFGLSAYALPLIVALPLLHVVAILPITPGGLGVGEWAWSAVLAGAGAALNAAALFAIAGRVLSIFVMGVLLFALLAARAVRGWAVAAPAGASREMASPDAGRQGTFR